MTTGTAVLTDRHQKQVLLKVKKPMRKLRNEKIADVGGCWLKLTEKGSFERVGVVLQFYSRKSHDELEALPRMGVKVKGERTDVYYHY